jgi:hypothetical protein
MVQATGWTSFAFPYFLKHVAAKRGLEFSSPERGTYKLTKPAKAAAEAVAVRVRKAPRKRARKAR